MKRLIFILLALFCSATMSLHAQNTIGFTYGLGSGFVRAYPSIETKSVYGLSTASLQWRHYSSSLNVGCVGIDVEYMQRGFAYAPYTSTNNNNEGNEDVELLYYYRYINSIMVPIIWQPYVYMFDNRVRVFADAAVTFSYNISSTYKNDLYNSYGYDDNLWQGEYEMRSERDNKFGYGLAFGGGITYIMDRIEVQASMRYYFGYSDIVKNRQLYYTNETDSSAENPFSLTPIRSPLDNFNFKVGVSYRLGKNDYAAWYTKRLKSTGLRDGFDFEAEASSGQKSDQTQGRGAGSRNSNTKQIR